MAGGGGSGLVAMGTQPMAAARANGSHAATEAMFGAIVKRALYRGKNTKISFTLFPVQKKALLSHFCRLSASPTPAPPPPKISHFHSSNPMVQHSFSFPNEKNPPPDISVLRKQRDYSLDGRGISSFLLPPLLLCVSGLIPHPTRRRDAFVVFFFSCAFFAISFLLLLSL